MKCSYVSILSTEAYLPGVLVLHYSLVRTGSRHPFLLLITPNVSERVRHVLAHHNIEYQVLERPIANPKRVGEGHRWYYNYSKIHIFNQIQFDKIVFLDADMLVNRNLDELFNKPHMSAVNSGGLLPELSSWRQLNSGLLVVEPSTELFSDMVSQVGAIEGSQPGGDQAFLHAYFADWPNRKELHLDHTYNMFQKHIDRYHELFGYTLEEIKVFHFIGETKPWTLTQATAPAAPAARWRGRAAAFFDKMRGINSSGVIVTLGDEAIQMWLARYNDLLGARGQSNTGGLAEVVT